MVKILAKGLLKGAMAIGTKLFMALASEKLIEWLLFYVGHQVVLSTKTKHDDEFYRQIKAAYERKK